ncbi:MAG: alpha/beta fold hydrolase [Chitinispirillaceae bacterium]|nr:alpha/beta fold hydrolase [Chitinispirillaceae bacterium]
MAADSHSFSVENVLAGYLSRVGSEDADSPATGMELFGEKIKNLCTRCFEDINNRHRYVVHTEAMIEDLDAVMKHREKTIKVNGYIARNGCNVDEKHSFEDQEWLLFTKSGASEGRLMEYRITFNGEKETLIAFSEIGSENGARLWEDSILLYAVLYEGALKERILKKNRLLSAGMIQASFSDFMQQLLSRYSKESYLRNGGGALLHFGRKLQDRCVAAGPAPRRRIRAIPLYTTKGITERHPGIAVATHPFQTEDNIGLTLTRFTVKESDNIVLLIHGLTSSSDMFIMPEHKNLVSSLLDSGYKDVWCLDCRMSNRFVYNFKRHRYTLDDVALYDIPAALRLIRGALGDGVSINVVCHCLGSVSFMMSLFAGKAGEIRSIVANSVSLHPRVDRWSKVKLAAAPFFMEYIAGLPYIDPCWRDDPGLTKGKIIASIVDRFHKECDNSSCHMISFMWGTGRPAAYMHGNLDPRTHDRLGDLFGPTGIHYYRHLQTMVKAGRAVKYNLGNPLYDELPDEYLPHHGTVTTPMLLISGTNNRIFPGSNKATFNWMRAKGMKNVFYQEIPGYGHQDVFMGKNADNDVFRNIAAFISDPNAYAHTSTGE